MTSEGLSVAEQLTLESLARRVERIEEQLKTLRGIPPTKDWRQVVGMFSASEFMKQVDEEGRKIREADGPETST